MRSAAAAVRRMRATPFRARFHRDNAETVTSVAALTSGKPKTNIVTTADANVTTTDDAARSTQTPRSHAGDVTASSV